MAYTTIKKPSDYFNTKIFTGDGSLPRAITGVGHQPDFVWLKNRDVGYQHQLYDSVRGTSAGVLYSSLSDAEDSTYQMSSFDSDGYTMGSQMGAVNGSGENIVSWSWKANGAGSSNTDGSITSTVSANTTSGFSIVSYTGNNIDGTTVGHGLGVNPSAILFKRRDSTSNWSLMGQNIGTAFSSYLKLETTDAFDTNGGMLQNSNSSTFTIGTNSRVNASSASMIAYCFAEKKGFSKFGSYTGNGNDDGTFVYTGFSPSFVIRKRTDSADSWQMHDNKRDTFNATYHRLLADDSGSEYTSISNQLDFLSNGFKCRASNSGANGSGGSYIYMAFAEQPLVGDNPCTAR